MGGLLLGGCLSKYYADVLVIGTAWYNCEFRVYEFLSDSGDQARLIETTESREGRGGVLLTEQEQLRLKALSEKEWEG